MKYVTIVITALLFVGCASVPMESQQMSDQAKQFNPPSDGMSGLYIYRDGLVGAALKKDVFVNGECVGESAKGVFFYLEVPGDQEQKISTESEFSPNDLLITTDANKNYFVEQFIKMGVFVGGAGLREVEADKAMRSIEKLDLATPGKCSN